MIDQTLHGAANIRGLFAGLTNAPSNMILTDIREGQEGRRNATFRTYVDLENPEGEKITYVFARGYSVTNGLGSSLSVRGGNFSGSDFHYVNKAVKLAEEIERGIQSEFYSNKIYVINRDVIRNTAIKSLVSACKEAGPGNFPEASDVIAIACERFPQLATTNNIAQPPAGTNDLSEPS
jgi:hypothetical protein